MANFRKWKNKNYRRKRRFGRKRNYFKKGAKFNKTGYLSVQQKVASSPYSVGPGAWPAAGVTHNIFFNVNEIGNIVSYSKLFDQYRISGVKLVWNNIANPNTSGNFSYNMAIVKDIDGGTFLSYADLLQFSSCKVINVDEQKTRYTCFIKPRVRNLVDGGPATDPTKPNILARQVGSNRWLDLALTTGAAENVPHYGVKWGWNGTQPLNTVSPWTLDITYYVQFRKVR